MKTTFQSLHTLFGRCFGLPVRAESISSLELLEVEGGTINFTGTELHLLTVVWTS